ncbi:MAG TPA: 30S ribosomal protein S9 [Candidatus Bathyarchaeia archaeon]|nr:30S ribosomal protein S9 [Candidatus Bathyarchaeia archaeon]
MVTKKPKKLTKAKKAKKPSFIFAVGRRRTASARIRLYPHKKGEIMVNDQPIEKYFPGEILKQSYLAPLRTCNAIDKYLITIKVKGSGKIGQLGAVVHGLARALEKLDREKFRPILKKRGFMTRDPRKRERRKIGMGGKARRKRQSPRR